MDKDARTTGPEVEAAAEVEDAADQAGSQRSPDELRADIEETRGQVGDTVEALAEKTDVKAQARQRVGDVKANLGQKRDDLTAKARTATPDSAQRGGQQMAAKVRENPAPVALGGAVLAGFVLGRLTGRRS